MPTTGLPATSEPSAGRVPIPARRTSVPTFHSTDPALDRAWRTNYDFVRHEFACHVVSLQRDLHDWRAIFGFTQSPNGNFAFNFSIGLKAQPDLKFDYARNSIRSSALAGQLDWGQMSVIKLGHSG